MSPLTSDLNCRCRVSSVDMISVAQGSYSSRVIPTLLSASPLHAVSAAPGPAHASGNAAKRKKRVDQLGLIFAPSKQMVRLAVREQVASRVVAVWLTAGTTPPQKREGEIRFIQLQRYSNRWLNRSRIPPAAVRAKRSGQPRWNRPKCALLAGGSETDP